MNHSFCVGRERRNPDVGQAAFPRVHPVFFLLAASFRCSEPVFHPGSPSKIVPTPFIYRDDLPIINNPFFGSRPSILRVCCSLVAPVVFSSGFFGGTT